MYYSESYPYNSGYTPLIHPFSRRYANKAYSIINQAQLDLSNYLRLLWE
jgi:hypothetical protein